VSFPRGDAYQERFDALAAEGRDVHGEATFVRAFAPSRVLDAGCGTGRVAIELARHGIDVVGVDVDPAMLETARRRAPDLDWRIADLATLELGPDAGTFDLAVLAGNVLLFVESGTEPAVLERVATALRDGGRCVAGFQLRPGGFGLDALDRDAARAGLTLESRWSTWDRAAFPRPDGAADDYAVSVFVRGPRTS
jgi:SAM-dependent methyltransferase